MSAYHGHVGMQEQELLGHLGLQLGLCQAVRVTWSYTVKVGLPASVASLPRPQILSTSRPLVEDGGGVSASAPASILALV